MRLLILGSRDDATVQATQGQARGRYGAGSVRLCTFEDLAGAAWTHRLGENGVGSGIRLGDGFTLAAFQPTVVFNRLAFPSGPLFPGWSEVNRDYGGMELFALLLSVLHALACPVVNRPGPAGLAGPALGPLAWYARAAAAGLPVHETGATTSTRRFPPPPAAQLRTGLMRTLDEDACARLGLHRPLGYALPANEVADVLVVGTRVVGGIGPALDDACVRLAREAGAVLLGIQLARTSGDPQLRIINADPAPAMLCGARQQALFEWLEASAA